MQASRSLRGVTEEIVKIATQAHSRYDGDVWVPLEKAQVQLSSGNRVAPSYHNSFHVRSVVDCARTVFSKIREKEIDPFDINRNLACWNEKERNRAGAVSLDQLEVAVLLAFACHDLGNITRSAEFDADRISSGKLFEEAAFYDSSTLYTCPEVEYRSAEISDRILDVFLEDSPEKHVIKPLVHHLILQTIFQFDKVTSDELFWLFMQTVDMVGSYFFSPTARRVAVAGLFNEMRVQHPGTITIYPFLTSLGIRFERLIPDPAKREQVLQIFESNPYGQSRQRVFTVSLARPKFFTPLPFEDAIRILLEGDTLVMAFSKG